jgi:hypothetical protein
VVIGFIWKANPNRHTVPVEPPLAFAAFLHLVFHGFPTQAA